MTTVCTVDRTDPKPNVISDEETNEKPTDQARHIKHLNAVRIWRQTEGGNTNHEQNVDACSEHVETHSPLKHSKPAKPWRKRDYSDNTCSSKNTLAGIWWTSEERGKTYSRLTWWLPRKQHNHTVPPPRTSPPPPTSFSLETVKKYRERNLERSEK